ncbi:MAG: hypothetical protein IKE03_06330 [Blautia sp.]|nr:hypothetical protein [Blautia sp.]
MKAVVAELRNGEAAVLCMDGIVRIVSDTGLELGQAVEIEVVPEPEKTARFTSISALPHGYLIPAAAFAGMILTAGGVAAAVTVPVSTVTMDISGKIEYGLNIFDKVVSVSAPDEKGLPLADSLRGQIIGRNIEAAVERTLDVLVESGKILDEKESIEAAVQSRFQRETELEERLTDKVAHWNNFRETYGNSPVELSFRDAAGETRPADLEGQGEKKSKKNESAVNTHSQPPQEKKDSEKNPGSKKESGGEAKSGGESEKAEIREKARAEARTSDTATDSRTPQDAAPGEPAPQGGQEAAGADAQTQTGSIDAAAGGQSGDAAGGAADPAAQPAAGGAADPAAQPAAGGAADPAAQPAAGGAADPAAQPAAGGEPGLSEQAAAGGR